MATPGKPPKTAPKTPQKATARPTAGKPAPAKPQTARSGRSTATPPRSAARAPVTRTPVARTNATRTPAPAPSAWQRLQNWLLRLRPGAGLARPSAQSARAAAAYPAHPPAEGMSLDRKLDIAGIVMIFIGLPTLLSLLSATQSDSTAAWIGLLRQAFGGGAFFFPLSLMLVGGWLVVRNFERFPRPDPERMTGLTLLLGNLLAFLHLFALPANSEISYRLAEQGRAGGYVGAFFFELLRGSLGLGGAVIALIAWFLVGLMLLLDLSLADLFRWVRPLLAGMREWIEEMRARRAEAGLYDEEFQPLQPPPANRAAAAAQAHGRAVQAGQPGAAVAEATYPPPLPWTLPAIEQILEPGTNVDFDDEFDLERARTIEDTLASFGAPVNVVEINRGPTITQFGVEPDYIETRNARTRVRVGKIVALADDLALALSARAIRIQAPVPGKGYVGIEVPNEGAASVALRDVIESEAFRRFKSPLRFALGQDVSGAAAAADLAAMPHLLIAGATGSGKSVCVNAVICCMLLHNTPDDLRLIMVDPKRVELTGYNGIPHLLAPVVVDTERVVGALQWVLREMDTRYHKLAQAGARNITEYNARLAVQAPAEKPMPRLVVIIDELADLMMLAPEETERAITRLAQLARATGIHLILATQRPSVDVVTGLIKANIPARIAFAVASGVDSRVILDQPGAERLLGRGDMLFQAPDSPAPLRLQGAFLSDVEIQRLVAFWVAQNTGGMTSHAGGPVDAVPSGIPLKQMELWDEGKSASGAASNKDVLYDEALELCRRQGRASISMLQRRLRIGYTRAARLIEAMQDDGLIGKESSSQGFEILNYGQTAPPIDEG